jgi:enamine deaminase RidA (YjgF/YER057c/UK114 family)
MHATGTVISHFFIIYVIQTTHMRTLFFALLLQFSFQADAQKTPTLTSLENPDFLSPVRGYSHVARIDLGNAWMLVISGQVAMDRDGNIVGRGNMEVQTDFVYARIIDIIKHYGGTRDHLVRTGILILDEKDIPVVRQVRTRYLNMDKPPTSTAMVVAKLFHPDFLVEIEAMAVIPKATDKQ